MEIHAGRKGAERRQGRSRNLWCQGRHRAPRGLLAGKERRWSTRQTRLGAGSSTKASVVCRKCFLLSGRAVCQGAPLVCVCERRLFALEGVEFAPGAVCKFM